MNDGLTKDDCVNAICNSIGSSLTNEDEVIIDNIVTQYTTDLAMRVTRASSAKVSEIIEQAIAEVK